ncbi:MAG: pyridoxamine 5'-phosphate oxidase family protein [Lachnospiraceae bacterium]|nr:pyridoxamine 5'-phosphate oxidase family protein [Lachnospiraceae bacterium]
MQSVNDFLKKAGTYYLATVDGDQPRVRPFGTVNVYDGKLYIQTGKVKDVSKQLAKNPKAEISAFTDGEWIRLSGTLVEDDSVGAVESMLDAYPDLRGMYKAGDGNAVTYYFKDATAKFYKFSPDPPRVVTF